jgi:hypothetical protein
MSKNANRQARTPAGNEETLRLLFNVHHRQMEDRRTKIHNITEKTMALLIVIGGWLMVSENPPSGKLRWVLVSAIALIAITACIILYSNNRAYLQVASVVKQLNEALHVHDKGHYLENEALYPEAWKSWGILPWKTIWHHWVFIPVLAFLCIIGAFARGGA